MTTKTNPYIEGRKEWSDRYGDHIKAKRNWQIATFICLGVISLESSLLAWQSSQSSVQPYIVQMDDLRRVIQVVPAEKAGGINDPRILRSVIGDFIRNTRTIIADPPAMKRLLNQAYAYSAPAVRQTLNDHYRENDPFQAARNHTIAVDISTILALSEKTWQVQWAETRRAPDGRQLDRTNWQAVASLTIEPPRQSIDEKNPLGIYVTALSWTETH
jgi:type IV secretory pathway TrbF-like protein